MSSHSSFRSTVHANKRRKKYQKLNDVNKKLKIYLKFIIVEFEAEEFIEKFMYKCNVYVLQGISNFRFFFLLKTYNFYPYRLVLHPTMYTRDWKTFCDASRSAVKRLAGGGGGVGGGGGITLARKSLRKISREIEDRPRLELRAEVLVRRSVKKTRKRPRYETLKREKTRKKSCNF